jgi:hypothetical protein
VAQPCPSECGETRCVIGKDDKERQVPHSN